LLELKIPLTPVPASRPRVTKWGTYYGKRYTQYQKDCKTFFDTQEVSLISQPVLVRVIFAIPRSRTGKLETPVGDGDNYEKALYDVIQHSGVLEDDRLITSASWRKRFLPYGRAGYTSLEIWPESEPLEIT